MKFHSLLRVAQLFFSFTLRRKIEHVFRFPRLALPLHTKFPNKSHLDENTGPVAAGSADSYYSTEIRDGAGPTQVWRSHGPLACYGLTL